MSKKKIKDLTEEERMDICRKHACYRCPLKDKQCSCLWLDIDINKLPERYLNKKVEVKK